MSVFSLTRVMSASAIALSLISGSVAIAQPKSRALDFQKINTAIAGALLEVYKNDPIVSNVTFTVDPKTDLNANRIAVSAATTVQRSAWSSNATTLTTSLSGEALAGATPRTVRLGVQLSLNMKTDSLAFIKYLVQLAEESTQTCVAPSSTEPFERELNLFLCGQDQKTLAAKDLVEIRGIYEGSRSGAEAIVQKHLVLLNQQLAANPPPHVVRQLTDDKKSLEEILKFVKAILISPRLDAAGNETGFEAMFADGYDYQALSLKSVGLIIERDHSEVNVAFQVNEFEKAQFMQFKGMAEAYLMALESGDAAMLQSIVEAGEGYMQMVKEIIRDRKQSP